MEDVRDLGGQFGLQCCFRAGKGCYAWGCCGRCLGVQVRSGSWKFLPAGLHAVEASCVSAFSLGAFRAAIVRSVWSSKMPLADTLAILNLLDGPFGVDLVFPIVWTRFHLMWRYLAHRPLEACRIYRMLDLVAHGAPGHGPAHLLIISAAELGFVWLGNSKAGYVLHSRLAEREGFRGAQFLDIRGSLQLLISSHLRERDKHVVRIHALWRIWNGFLVGKARGDDVKCHFSGSPNGDGHLFWNYLSSHSSCARAP